MNFTVQQALEMDVMEGSVLLAGNKGINNKIVWVNINEILDEFDYFRQGEFFITTGFDLRHKSKGFYVKLVKLLNSCNIAALAVQIGYYIEAIPVELINLCDTYKLPLVQLPKSLSFSALIRDILENVLMAHVKELEHSKSVHAKLTQLVFEGRGLDELANNLSSMLNSAVQIFDNKFNSIACSDLKYTSCLLESPRQLFEDYFSKPVNKSGLITAEKIVVNDDTYGYIVVNRFNDEPFTDLENITISTAKTIVALIMLNEKALIEREEGLKGDLLDDIIDGNCTEEVLLRRFRYLGYPISNYVVYIAHTGDPNSFHQTLNNNIQVINEKLLSIIKKNLLLNQHKYILKIKGKKIIIMVHVKNDMEKVNVNKSFLSIISSAKKDTSSSISVGFGRNCIKLSDIKYSLIEATKALKIGKYIWKKNFIVGYEELGIYRLFIENASQEELKIHYDATVGQIIEYDRAQNTNLFATLEAFYKCNKSIIKTAKQLFIHRHTLRYRLERIKSITGLDTNNSKDSLALQIGILIYYILESW